MKRVLTLFVACCMMVMVMLGGIASVVSADSISREQAEEIAVEWMSHMGDVNVSNVSAEKVLKEGGIKVGYLITFHPSGYVVVSADDSLAPIKSWSERGVFKGPMREMTLESLVNEINQKQSTLDSGSSNIVPAGTKPDFPTYYVETVIGPLVHTKWGQNYPYNSECPVDYNSGHKSVVGCVATAMAQIMRYWKWPKNGISDKCYQPKNEDEICDDFEHPYDWDAMPSKLYADSDPWAIFQISRLLHDVGVIAETRYSSSTSWGYYQPLSKGMEEYMDYSCNITTVDKAELFYHLQPNLSKRMPVFLGGNHAFVCDGYLIGERFIYSSTSGGYRKIRQLHFNFGWNGLYNGWYAPAELGNDFNFFRKGRTYYYVIKDLHPSKVECQPTGGIVASSYPPREGENQIVIPAKKFVFRPELIIPQQDRGKEAQPVMWLSGEKISKIFWGKHIMLYNSRYVFFSKMIDFGLSKGKISVYLGYLLLSGNRRKTGRLKYARYQLIVK